MSEKPYTYDDLVHDLHRAINSKQNPRQAYNFLRALCGMPTAQPVPSDLLEAAQASAKAREVRE